MRSGKGRLLMTAVPAASFCSAVVSINIKQEGLVLVVGCANMYGGHGTSIPRRELIKQIRLKVGRP